MDKPLVSIIVPVYNCSEYITACIDSIIKGCRSDIEIILVDDGSTDNSGKICDEYSNRFSFVRCVHQNQSGVSCARNNGIAHASGTYVMFVDSDDFINNQLVDRLIEYIGHSDIAIAGYSLYDDKSDAVTNIFPCFYSEGSSTDLAGKIGSYINPPYLLGPCFKLFKLDIIQNNNIKFPRDISYCEDALFVFNYLRHIKSYVSIRNAGYYYRQHGSFTLSTSFRKDLFYCECLLNKAIESFLTDNNVESDDMLRKRLFKAFVHNLHKLSCTPIPLVEKTALIGLLVQDNQLDILFSQIPCSSLDDIISLEIVKDKSKTWLLYIMKIELKLRSIIKQILVQINYVH